MADQSREAEEAEDRDYFMGLIEEMEEDHKHGTVTYEMPHPHVVKFHDLLGKLWGWDRLLPMGDSVSWSDYSVYLQEYHRRNADAIGTIAALAQTCLDIEEQLVSEWKKIQVKSEILPMRQSIVLGCLIHQRVRSFIRTGCSFSHVSGAALLCIAWEADLTCELLRRGADPDDELIDEGREIRTCALSLMMNCTSDDSVAASAAMLGMAKEAEMVCAWMCKNNKPVDFCDFDMPDEISDSHEVRCRTFNVMVNILEESSAAAAATRHKIDKEEPASRNGPGGDGDGITAANTTGMKKDLMEKLWGWERLLPLSGSVEWTDYCSYLEEYYKRNALEFFANQNPEDLQIANMGAAVAKSCLKMEEELLSEWKTRVKRSVYDTLPLSTIIQSSVIKELALSVCSTGGELFAPSDVAFVCIIREAELMCELLKQGAQPIDGIIQQSSVIRTCALGLANLKGHQSIPPAAAMLGIAKEAKKMCDWVKREKKLATFSLFEPHDLEECRLIRIKAFDVMTNILHDSSFPCPKMRDNDAMACD
ncbi:unnamed protein product [Alopecurus aequalis]